MPPRADKIKRRTVAPLKDPPPEPPQPSAAEAYQKLLDERKKLDPVDAEVIVQAAPVLEESELVRGRNTSVYFANGADLRRLEELAKTHPRASVSNIVSQLVKCFLKVYVTLPQGERIVEMNGQKVHL